MGIGVDSDNSEGVYIMGTTSARSWITSKRIMSSDLAAAVVKKAGSGRLVPYLAQLLLSVSSRVARTINIRVT